MEIREPYDDEQEKKWKEERKIKLKETKVKERTETDKVKDDDDYWKRLDELEVIMGFASNFLEAFFNTAGFFIFFHP